MYYDDMIIITGEEAGQFDHRHDLYEKIEAPKFVDFTAPERCHPDHDDRYWFCMRVGCDRKHEEEIDPQEIDKNFILRVMAARSPSVRSRRALHRKASSTNMKCPQKSPPKSRLETISSRVRATPLSKLTTTPNVKPNPRPFREVKSPKPLDVAPKKTLRSKPPVEVKTPSRKACSVGSKPRKRAVGDVKARGFDSGQGEKSSRCESGPREDNESSDMEIDESSRKGSLDVHCKSNDDGESLAGAKVVLEMLSESSIEAFEFNDSRDYEGLSFLDGDGKSRGKSSSEGKMTSEGTDDKENALVSDDKEKDEEAIDSTDDKENASSLDDKEKDKEVIESTDDKENASSHDDKEKYKEVINSTDDKENASTPDDKEKGEEVINSTDDKENVSSPDDKEKGEEVIDSTDDKENASSLDDKEKCKEVVDNTDDKENVSSLDDKEKQEELIESTDDKENVLGENAPSPDGTERYNKAMKSFDDKENASALDDNKKHDKVVESTHDKENVPSLYDKEKHDEVTYSDHNNKISSSPDDKEKHDQIVESDDKENVSAPDANRKQDRLNQGNAKSKILGKHKNSKCIQKNMQVSSKTMKETSGKQVVKYEKPKPTNPKPFRLRTDERRILKEAKMEKKLNLLKEVTTITSMPKRTKLDVPQESEKDQLKKIITRKDRDQDQPRKKASLVDLQPSEKQVKDVAKRTKLPLMKQPARPQWVSSTGKEKPSLKVAPCQLTAIHETRQTMLKHKKAPSKKETLPTTKPSPPQPPHYFLMGKCMYQDSNLRHNSHKSALLTT